MHLLAERFVFFFFRILIRVFCKWGSRPIKWHRCHPPLPYCEFFPVFTSVVYGEYCPYIITLCKGFPPFFFLFDNKWGGFHLGEKRGTGYLFVCMLAHRGWLTTSHAVTSCNWRSTAVTPMLSHKTDENERLRRLSLVVSTVWGDPISTS